ncbi:MAG: dTMP kinase [Alphaproteobacteria bacterium]
MADEGTRHRGPFITFEGGEGAGKTTQIRRLADRLLASGHRVLTTREPGGSPGADAIRALLVTGEAERWRPESELFLFAAARADHVARVIAPALQAGQTVLCDRFSDSTLVYQGHGHGLDRDMVADVNRIATGNLVPDLTLILDVPVTIGLARAAERGGAAAEDRFERMGHAFHQRLWEGFRALAVADPERCRLIDAAGDPDAVAEGIWRIVEPWIAAHGPSHSAQGNDGHGLSH